MLDFVMRLFGYENKNNILIQDDFKLPKAEKLTNKARFHLATGKFQDQIIINRDKVLLDGYVTYIICKKKYVKVLKIDMDPLDYRINYKINEKKNRR